MKKTICLCLIMTLLLCLSFEAYAVEKQATTCYELSSVGISISIPSEYVVLSRDMQSSELMDNLSDEMKEEWDIYIKENDSYLEAYNPYSDRVISVTSNDNYISYLNLLPNKSADSIMDGLVKMHEDIGETVNDYGYYQHPQAKFIKINLTGMNGKRNFLVYSTIYNYKSIRIWFILDSEEVSTDTEQAAEKVINSIIFSTADTSSDKLPEINTDAEAVSDSSSEPSPLPTQVPTPAPEASVASTSQPASAVEPLQTPAPSPAINAEVLYRRGMEYFTNLNDYEKALEDFKQAADAGNPDAMFQIGYFYDEGLGVEQDYVLAKKWYEKAADLGNAGAMCNIGYLYETGKGVERDYMRAKEWYQKSADLGNADAMNNLGYFYESIVGMYQDYKLACGWYTKAANAGNDLAMNNLGNLYASGLGVSKDYAQAMTWYKLAAEAGNSDAMNSIGYFYENGFGVTQDYSNAAKWYQKAADAGNPLGMHNLAVMYYYGFGVKKDAAEADKWFAKAIEAGY